MTGLVQRVLIIARVGTADGAASFFLMTQPGDESTGLYSHNVPSQQLKHLYSCTDYIDSLLS